MIPGGTPFSQLNRGVKDAMVESTGMVERQFMTKHAERPSLENKVPHRERKSKTKPSTERDKIAEEGSGEVIQTAPMPEQQRNDIDR